VDIDHFKYFSITNGHIAGDRVVKAVVQMITKKLRTQDLLACMVIDRFAALLPDTPPDVAMKIAERLREAVEDALLHLDTNHGSPVAGNTPTDQDKRVTISIGVAAMQPEDSLDSMLATAEKALSQSKEAGRNQVKIAATGSLLQD
jgi:diguanylate cyclase (GGDEF)-like protein